LKEKRIEEHLFTIVPYSDNILYLSKKGIVYNSLIDKTLDYIIRDNEVYIEYNNELISVAYLLALTFIGKHDGDIIFKDGNHKNCISKNISYTGWATPISEIEIIINNEVFRMIERTGGRFYISEYGVIFDKHYGFLHLQTRTGYYRARIIYDDGHRKDKEVNRLVYSTYIGPIPKEYVVDHIDGIPWHNHPSNLEAVSFEENIRRAYDSDTYGRNRVWTKDQIHNICKMMEEGKDIYQISDSMGLHNGERRNLTNLLVRLSSRGDHSDITSQYDISNYSINRERIDSRTSNYNDIKNIVNLIHEGFTDTQISKEMGIPRIKVYQIRNMKVYKDFIMKAKVELGIE